MRAILTGVLCFFATAALSQVAGERLLYQANYYLNANVPYTTGMQPTGTLVGIQQVQVRASGLNCLVRPHGLFFVGSEGALFRARPLNGTGLYDLGGANVAAIEFRFVQLIHSGVACQLSLYGKLNPETSWNPAVGLRLAHRVQINIQVFQASIQAVPGYGKVTGPLQEFSDRLEGFRTLLESSPSLDPAVRYMKLVDRAFGRLQNVFAKAHEQANNADIFADWQATEETYKSLNSYLKGSQ